MCNITYNLFLKKWTLKRLSYFLQKFSYILGGSNDKVDTTYDGKNGVRCLRISTDGRSLASGDRSGNIR